MTTYRYVDCFGNVYDVTVHVSNNFSSPMCKWLASDATPIEVFKRRWR